MPTTYEPIATTTLSSSGSTVTFSSIPATYTDLRLVCNYFTTGSASYLQMRFNSDTTSTYSGTNLNGNGTTASSNRNTATGYFYINSQHAATDIPALVTSDIFSYAGSTYKTCLNTCSVDRNGGGGLERRVAMWPSTAAINTILITSTQPMSAGSVFTLYGILKA